MTGSRSAVLLLCSFFASVSAFPQQLSPAPQRPSPAPQTAVVQSTPIRDPQAVATVAQALAAAGGAQAFAAIQDYSASGQITYFWAGKEVTGSVTLRGRVPDQVRVDASLPEGTRSWYVNRGNGAIRDSNGKTSPIPTWTATSAGNLGLPLIPLSTAVADAATSVALNGQAAVGTASANRIHVQRSIAKKQDPTGDLAKWSAKNYLIDPQSLQVIGVQDSLRANKFSMQEIDHEFLYSNYRQINGISVPFTITEVFGGQTTWRIDLQSISFNSGLTNDVFHF